MAQFTFLELAGMLAIVTITFVLLRSIWKFLYANYIGYALGHTISPRSCGEWAIVTGSTDGIGKAYAEEMAALGLNIVLISRSLPKLISVANEIENSYGVKTRVIDVDFTTGLDIYKRIGKEIEGLEIGVLVNNVGANYHHPEYLINLPNVREYSEAIINCNSVSVVQMCLLVLDQMVVRKKGLIMNISSASIVVPLPLMTLYSSTKGFVYRFTRDLALEYTPFGITVQCVMPGWVSTNMSKIRKPSLQAPLPKTYVKSQMKTLGLEVTSNGYWPHHLEVLYYHVMKTFAPSYLNRIVWNKMCHHRNSGLRYMKKLRESQANVQYANNKTK